MRFNISMIAALAAAAVASAQSPAHAGDIQGDAYDCQELWVMKNQIFKDRGYCFKTTRAINHFGNAGCEYDSEAEVPLTRSDRIVLRDVKKSMRRQGC